jgi:hypothetical protein
MQFFPNYRITMTTHIAYFNSEFPKYDCTLNEIIGSVEKKFDKTSDVFKSIGAGLTTAQKKVAQEIPVVKLWSDSHTRPHGRKRKVCLTITDTNGEVKEIGDRLRSQARFVMFNDLSKDPDEEHAWSRAQSDFISYQQKHDPLTIETTSQSIQTALSMFESHNDRQKSGQQELPNL